MGDTDNDAARRKRVRLFGRDPYPGIILSLDTSRQELPMGNFSRSTSCGQKTFNPTAAVVDKATTPTDTIASNEDSARPTPDRDSLGGPGEQANQVFQLTCNDDDKEQSIGENSNLKSPQPESTSTTPGIPGSPFRGNTPGDSGLSFTTAQHNYGLLYDENKAELASSPFATTAAPAAAAVLSFNSSSIHSEHTATAKVDAATTAVVAEAAAAATGNAEELGCQRTRTVCCHPEGKNGDALAHHATSPTDEAEAVEAAVAAADPAENGWEGATAQLAEPPTQETKCVSAAASMVASFFRRASPPLPAQAVGPPAPSPADHHHQHLPHRASGSLPTCGPASPPTTPVQLASLITGVPSGSGGSAAGNSGATNISGVRQRGLSTMGGTAGGGSQLSARGGTEAGARGVAAGSVVRSPPRVSGGSRFFNDEWSPRLKERRRIVRFPKRSEPASTRILYWVRGNYRVRDNLALSVAMWLSTKLRMPLQAVTFVDPALGRFASSSSIAAKRRRSLSGARAEAGGQQLSFRTAVEGSALCEMQQALRALNVPLVAMACDASEIPAVLARLCGVAYGNSSGSAADTSPVASPACTATATGMAKAAVTGLPIEGRVHVAITDESYHPRQLWLTERAKEGLLGVALYAVDSSCICPVNIYRGGRLAAAAGANKVFSLEEFRQTQEDLLPTVRTELVPQARLPLEARLQSSVFGDDGRAALPREFDDDTESATASVVVVEWSELHEMVSRRFQGFGKPVSRSLLASSTTDLIALLGGGERAGEMVLLQTLEMAVSALGDRPPNGKSASLEIEVAGLGFGGSLLHLLRLGSVSSLSCVQALLDRELHVRAGGEPQVEEYAKRSAQRLLDAVMNREYALYRSFLHYQREGRRAGVAAAPAATPRGSSATNERVWRAKDWMRIVPGWVWEELERGQRDARQHQHSPGEIKTAGSTLSSSVHDAIFSAIQVRLANGARLHPALAPYWARAVVKMVLIPSQAVSLIIDLVEDLCLGAAYAGDVVPDLLASAFDAFEDAPAASGSGSAVVNDAAVAFGRDRTAGARDMPIFRRLSDKTRLASREGLQAAFGGADALQRFVSPVHSHGSPPAS